MFPINICSMFLEYVFVLARLMFAGQRILGKSVCVCVYGKEGKEAICAIY